ncbi:MAG: GNAT family N-acetyltransferase [Candidatus Nanoarchaeia archaeon]
MLVATVDGQVVGNVYLVQDIWNSFIFRLAVRKNFRGRGIGSKLMEESERLLKEKGVKDVALFVESGDEELVDYYKRRGYISMDKLHQCMYKEL